MVRAKLLMYTAMTALAVSKVRDVLIALIVVIHRLPRDVYTRHSRTGNTAPDCFGIRARLVFLFNRVITSRADERGRCITELHIIILVDS